MRLRGTWYIVPTPFDAERRPRPGQPRPARRSGARLGRRRPDGHGRDGRARRPQRRPSGRRPCGPSSRPRAGRLPIAVGCSGGALGATLELIGQARELGACAAMVAAPPLFRNVDQLPDYFRQAATGGLPLVIQDEPNATGVVIPVSILLAAATRQRQPDDEDRGPAHAAQDRPAAGGQRRARHLRRAGRRLGPGRAAPGRLRHDDRLRLPGDPACRSASGVEAGEPASCRARLRSLPAADPVRGAAGHRPRRSARRSFDGGASSPPIAPVVCHRPWTRSRSTSSTTCSTASASCPGPTGFTIRPDGAACRGPAE